MKLDHKYTEEKYGIDTLLKEYLCLHDYSKEYNNLFSLMCRYYIIDEKEKNENIVFEHASLNSLIGEENIKKFENLSNMLIEFIWQSDFEVNINLTISLIKPHLDVILLHYEEGSLIIEKKLDNDKNVEDVSIKCLKCNKDIISAVMLLF